MFTPQQIEQISFSRATFGGYDMQSVDELLYPLTEDYKTLYKENDLLKSKMKVLVSKLEEYRTNEASMKDAIVNAQKTCDLMIKEAEAKCTKMLTDANATAMENAKNADALIAAEEARVEEARKVAGEKIDALKAEISACLNALDRIKAANPVAPSAAPAEVPAEPTETDAVADEISATLQALVGSADMSIPMAEPKHPTTDSTTGKFSNLQFGRNYDPTKR
ncbi:MAG: DivIVA domain-containing protein [Oscillospiraceae bacterium]|nr:DivIVA domain-containing protein [Oscillospiraceae bacterium]